MTDTLQTDTLPNDTAVTEARPAKSQLKHEWWWYVSTWFGCGMSPMMSGTVGSLGALPFACVIQYLGGNGMLFIASAVIFAVGCKASDLYLLHTGRDDDPRQIVVDEVAGQWLILSALHPTFFSYLLGFTLFRIFDILKPWPICEADEKIKGGFGIMLDDILAALYPILVYIVLLGAAYCIGAEKLLYGWLSFLT